MSRPIFSYPTGEFFHQLQILALNTTEYKSGKVSNKVSALIQKQESKKWL